MIKAIIFDLGGTYCTGSLNDFMNRSYNFLGIGETFHTDEEVIFDKDFNAGRVSIQSLFSRLFNIQESDPRIEGVIEIWKDTWKLEKEMVELVNRLKQNYRLALLSNSDAVNTPEFIKRGWYDPFEVAVLSHEEGILKPEKRIYEITLERLKLKPGECIFIDDQKRCLEPAENMGMKTILFDNLDQLKQELKKLGVQI